MTEPTVLDLRGDWAALPTPAMRRAMAEAELGNDMTGEDPTVNRLQERVADLLGKEAALLVASGTMGNLVAVLAQAPWGSEVIAGDLSHVYGAEQAGAAMLGGRSYRPVPTDRWGCLEPAAIRAAIRVEDIHFARAGLLCLENTHNGRGGVALTAEQTKTMADVAHEAGLPVHLDGSRLWHAAVALDVPPAELAAPVDTVQVCLSKGLAAPVGSVVAGPKDAIERALRMRKALGGAMRQAGVIAAAGLVALDEILPRLADDHARARRLAEGLNELPGVSVDLDTCQTNLVFARFAEGLDGRRIGAELEADGIRVSAFNPRVIRFALHYQIDDAAIDRVLVAMKGAVVGTAVA
jgi:threonine aldolase